MDYLPVALDLKDRPVLVVGGGEVAARKVMLLLRAGACVTVRAPELCDPLQRRLQEGAIDHDPAPYRDGALDAWWLIVAATDDAPLNEAVRRAADAAGRLCNVVDRRELCSFIMPSIVDRSPVFIAVSTGGSSPTLARRLRAWLEGALPRRLGEVARFAAGWRETARQRLSAAPARRAFQETLVGGRIADHVLAGRDAEAQREAAETLAALAAGQAPSGAGEVRIVGAGPGDPGLLTLHGHEALQWADVVLHDRLVSRAVLDLARRDATLHSVGKTAGHGHDKQLAINRRMVELARAGQRVVRLKGGDATLFARLGEELTALHEAGIPVRVIPGVTAAAGCAAYAGMPLSDRATTQAVVFVTAHGQQNLDRLDWPRLAAGGQTLVFYMGLSRAGYVAERLIGAGADAAMPAAVVGSGTTAQQVVRRGRLDALEQLVRDVPAPALLIVGPVALRADPEAAVPADAFAAGDPWSDAVWRPVAGNDA